MEAQICPRCHCEQKQDIRTWTYVKAIGRHLCPVCVLEGAGCEDPTIWERGGEPQCTNVA